MQLRYQADRLHHAEELDRGVGVMELLTARLFRRDRRLLDALHGTWLGHPLHPVLVDLPIGFWTSSMVLDLLGGERTAAASRQLVGAGVLAALPAALTGLKDWDSLGQERAAKRVGYVHAVNNGVALAAYALSWLARRRGSRGAGVALGVVGSAFATMGAYLGGHLSYRQGIGVDHTVGESAPGGWTRVIRADELGDHELTHATAGDAHVVLYRSGEHIGALAAHCSHLAGPLHEGRLVDKDGEACVRCPWHGSTFSFRDGRVVHGPATAPQPGYEARVADGWVEVKAKPVPKSSNGQIGLEALAGG
ncbi:MAG TPA: DUF2231 domain-containing protein [Egibacteraceae bacterium]|nr:DUF2231 domain-containing protein [Egibacteraceae bacterium]